MEIKLKKLKLKNFKGINPEKSPLLIRVFELVNPETMKIDANGNIPDYTRLPEERKAEEPTGPEGDLKEMKLFGIDMAGNKIRIKQVLIFGEWENGYSGWVTVPTNNEHLKSILESEI